LPKQTEAYVDKVLTPIWPLNKEHKEAKNRTSDSNRLIP